MVSRRSGKDIRHPLVIILVILLPHGKARVFENGVYVVGGAHEAVGNRGRARTNVDGECVDMLA